MTSRIFGLAVLLLALAFAGYQLALSGNGQAAQDGPAIGGHFTLTDQHGATVTEADFKGRHTLVFFGFTNCPDVCPTTLTTITGLMEELGDAGKALTPLFISVDSGDAPEAMASYLSNFHPAIVGLTGTDAQIKQAAAAYKVYYARVDQPESSLGYTMDHSSFLFLMGPDGEYITHFAYQDPLEKLVTRTRDALGK